MKLPFFLACLIIFSTVSAQVFPDLEWQRFYGKNGDDTPTSIALANDGSLLLGGSTMTYRPEETPDQNAWIIKVDTTGYELWEREVRLPGNQEVVDLKGTKDGGVIFCGVSSHITDHPEPASPQFRSDLIVGRLNALGELEWLHHYGGTGQDGAAAITEGVYNEWLVAGSAHSPAGLGEVRKSFGQSDGWMLKVDNQGEIRYSTSLGADKADWIQSAHTCENGDFLMAGYTNSQSLDKGPASSYGNGWVMRLNPKGEVLWSRVLHCERGGHFTKVLEMPDGRIALVGQKANKDGLSQGWLLKLSPDGATVQEKIFTNKGMHTCTDIALCQEGGLLIGGTSIGDTGPLAKGKHDFWLYRIDNQGDVVWKNTYGGPDFEVCVAVIEASPGLYYALGQKVNDFDEKKGDKKKDFWLLRLRELPCEYLQASIFVRANNNKVPPNVRIRFRANHSYATRFEWDFGDGTSSDLEAPLKSYRLPGMYQPRLTVYANEGCWRTVRLSRQLIVE